MYFWDVWILYRIFITDIHLFTPDITRGYKLVNYFSNMFVKILNQCGDKRHLLIAVVKDKAIYAYEIRNSNVY
jgi:hypothetical protein